MIDKKKCGAWAKTMTDLLSITKELTDDEAEYIKCQLSIAFAELKIEKLEAKSK